MNYIVHAAIQKSSIQAILTYLNIAGRRNKKEIEGNAILKTLSGENAKTELAKLDKSEKENLKNIIKEELHINETEVELILQNEPLKISENEIREIMNLYSYTLETLLGCLEIRKRQYYYEKQKQDLTGLYEIMFRVIEEAEAEKKENTKRIPLMRMRVNTPKSLTEAATDLCMDEKIIWNYEFKNCLPIHLIEKYSSYYKVNQQEIPIAHDDKNIYGNILKIIRKKKGITLEKAASEFGKAVSICRAYESGITTPPYSYVVQIIRPEIGTSAEEILVTAEKRGIKNKHIPFETIEYYRKTRYNVTKEQQRKQGAFLKEIGITTSEYKAGIFTNDQAKTAAELCGLGRQSKYLERELTETERKISESRIDPEKLKSAREESGLSVKKAADEIGYKRNMLYCLEKGQRKCMPWVLIKLAEVYKKLPEYFVNE